MTKKRTGKKGVESRSSRKRNEQSEARSEAKKIIRYGKVVYNVFWDSGGPGAGADYECVYRWRDKYAVCLSFDEPQGPFGTIRAAICGADLNFVTPATVEIQSMELVSKEIAKLLRCQLDPPFFLRINGEPWALSEKRKFVPKIEKATFGEV
ncbi:MAG: hypothetical protein A2162_07345 [Deltaproteobacteria bacterium RBG_13_52_11b]|nr:MAG: hypothetical protein A2162_07345 [Deltaproteobacteria bacterium RBG_13_52_11b]